jgi:plastocyanin
VRGAGIGKVALAALCAAGLTLAVTPAQAGKRPAKKTVKVEDYYFTPAKLTVKKDTTIVWKWPAGGGDSHDVVLRKGPRGAKRFASDILAADETFRQKLKVPGRYSIVCTLHEDDMKQTITVKR